MNTSSANKKGSPKKFNLIFFIDSEKTYHFKFNYILLKFLLSFFLIIIILSIFSIFISINIYKKNINFEKYITSLKKEVIEFYIDKEKVNENREDIVFSNGIKDDSERLKITEIDEANPNQTMVVNKTEKSINSSDKVEKNEVKRNDNSNEINVLNNTMVKIENPKILQEQNKTSIYFNLSNINQNKLPLSGSVCAVILGTNLKKESIIFKIPENLVLNNSNIPINCKDGEKVKFSRLRLTEFHINSGKVDFLLKQVNIYFYHKNLNGIILNTINN